VDGLNIYTYVRNNPLSFIDPFGLDGENKDYDLILTDVYLDFVYEDTYERLKNKDPYNLLDPVDEYKFDTAFRDPNLRDKKFYYEGNVYTGGEINYLGIGMYEAWKGKSLEDAQDKTFWWKLIRYLGGTPSVGTYEWLLRGYNKFINLDL